MTILAGSWNGWAQATAGGVWHQVEFRSVDSTAWFPCLGLFQILEPADVRDYRAEPVRRCRNRACRNPGD